MTALSPVGRGASINEVMRMTKKQAAFYLSNARFNLAPCGRRSGKTAIAKRRLVKKALTWYGLPGARFLACAPTHLQAKAIFWRDLKALVPKSALMKRASDSELTMELVNGSIIQVAGLDRPERVEGPPVAHLLIDEFGNVHRDAWGDNLRPTLTDTSGTADIIGVPEGRNHYWEMWTKAQQISVIDPLEWACHQWSTREVLPMYLGEEKAAKEISSAKASMDPLTYLQEYDATFNSTTGLIYYTFDRAEHAVHRLRYDPTKPLILCFDFNTSPGVCAYVQEQLTRHNLGQVDPLLDDTSFTAVIGEVWIPRNSNTPLVCRRIIEDWSAKGPSGRARIAEHKGDVLLHGDPAGGAKTTAAVNGSDWDIILSTLRPVFGDRLITKYARSHPLEKIRVNSVNTRLLTADGKKHMLIDPVNASKIVEDFEAVKVKEGSAGEIDKDSDKSVTHLTDAIGYYIAEQFPVMTAANSTDL